ncbi:MAG: glycosyl transferase family 2 [Solirubrobacterales bacterium]|jgi:hyaluronan synthase|nr:glycosyl transferase family 2 [Solirubrobacterales bacterium]
MAPQATITRRAVFLDRALRFGAGIYLVLLLVAIVLYKAVLFDAFHVSRFFGIYGLVVVAYIVSRFIFSVFYRPSRDHGLQPRVSIVMPSFNEGEDIAASLRSLLDLDYPAELLEIVAVNDGSTDDTLAQMHAVAAQADGRIRVIDLGRNRGKRAAMAAGIRATEADIIAFVDSDSVLAADAMTRLVQGFHDPKVGAICGHADVLNLHETWLTRMQGVRYFVAFKVIKAAESIFNCVTCCSGCFSAYRREAIMPHLPWWENQTFLGVESTFGDDRSLTNCVLRGWKVRYEANAVSRTAVPADFRTFMVQQLRWKRSWTRESLIVARFMWRKHPVAALSTYVGMILPLVAPVVAVRAMLWLPMGGHSGLPYVYLFGIYAMALAYGLYYVIRRRSYDGTWLFGIVFVFFYLAFLLWQTYYAILTARTSRWGTRPATAGMEAKA